MAKLKKIFFLEWSSVYQAELADELLKKNIIITYWAHFFDMTASNPIGDEMRAKFPRTHFHHVHDLLNFKIPPDLMGIPLVPLPPELTLALTKSEAQALAMIDRLSRKKMSLDEKKKYFIKMAQFCHGLLEFFTPQALVFATIPHTFYDFIFYEVAKFKGIKNILFERTAIRDQLMCFLDFKLKAIPLREDQSFEQLPAKFHAYYQAMKGEEQTDENNYFHRMNRTHKKKSQDYGILNDLRELFIIFKKIWHKGFFTRTRGTPFALDGQMYIGKIAFFRILALIKNYRLRAFYQKKARHFTAQQLEALPYFFVALHFQPERSTLPMGGDFHDQLSMIDVLAQSLPKSIKILIKEHPRQWGPRVLNVRGRSINFYQRLLQYPQVQFCHLNTPSNTLIQHALAVVTITGTTALEAFFKDRPALVFGHPWYQHCPWIYQVQDLNDCRQAIFHILQGKQQVSEKEKQSFLVETYRCSFEGFLEWKRKSTFLTDMPVKDCIDNLAKTIAYVLNEASIDDFRPAKRTDKLIVREKEMMP